MGLTSASATAYVAKKAAFPAPTKITTVGLQKGSVTAMVKILGSGFGSTFVTTKEVTQTPWLGCGCPCRTWIGSCGP